MMLADSLRYSCTILRQKGALGKESPRKVQAMCAKVQGIQRLDFVQKV